MFFFVVIFIIAVWFDLNRHRIFTISLMYISRKDYGDHYDDDDDSFISTRLYYKQLLLLLLVLLLFTLNSVHKQFISISAIIIIQQIRFIAYSLLAIRVSYGKISDYLVVRLVIHICDARARAHLLEYV